MLRPTILLAEDDPVIAMDLCWHLESRHLEPVAVDDPGQLLELCQLNRPTAVILNVLGHSDWNGWAIGRQLLEEQGIPVFFITGIPENMPDSPAFNQAGTPVLHKPFTSLQLRKCLDHWLA
jgi:DNA-binding response OmpR family regulator